MSYMRDEFEAAYTAAYPGQKVDRDPNGEYINMGAKIAWTVWQAARARGGQGAEPVGYTTKRHIEQLRSGRESCQGVFLKQDDYHTEPLYTQPQPAVPEETEAMVDAAVKVFEDAGARVDLGWLGEACRAYVAASFTPTTPQAEGWVRCDDRVHAKCGGRVVGRMRDGDSVSCEKCGKAGHVLIDDGGIDIDWTPAGQEGKGDE